MKSCNLAIFLLRSTIAISSIFACQSLSVNDDGSIRVTAVIIIINISIVVILIVIVNITNRTLASFWAKGITNLVANCFLWFAIALNEVRTCERSGISIHLNRERLGGVQASTFPTGSGTVLSCLCVSVTPIWIDPFFTFALLGNPLNSKLLSFVFAVGRSE